MYNNNNNYNNYNKYNSNNYSKNKYNRNNYNANNYDYFNQTNTIIGSWDNDKKKPFSKFRSTRSLKDRISESTRVMTKYPNKIPVICEKGIGVDNPDIDKNKYLVPIDLTIGNFLVVIRKRIKLQDFEALFLLVNGTIPAISTTFGQIYHRYKDEDGFVYMTYTKENVFG